MFSTATLHLVTPITAGRRLVFVPFLYGETDVARRLAENKQLAAGGFQRALGSDRITIRQFAVLATESTWSADDPAKVARANLEWIEDLAGALAPHVSRSAYQNFIDRTQPDWARAYYGKNLKRLSQVKRRYDPDGVFNGNGIR